MTPALTLILLTAQKAGFTTEAVITKKPALYPNCEMHSDCGGKNQFCALGCRTGNCGPTGRVSAGTQGKFCQPCNECKGPADSVNSHCIVCGVTSAGKTHTHAHVRTNTTRPYRSRIELSTYTGVYMPRVCLMSKVRSYYILYAEFNDGKI